MTLRQRERLGLYQKVIKHCTDNLPVIASSDKLEHYLHGFRSAVAAISAIDYLTNCIKENKVPATDELYNFLLPLAEAIGYSLLSFSEERGDNLLHQKITYSLSHTRAQSGDVRSASFVSIAETFITWMRSLEDYGMNDSIFNSFNAGIEHYMGIAPSRSNIPLEPEAYQECFRNVLYTANTLFKDRIDILIQDLSEENYRFYLSYRRIRTYGDINYLL
ncbi:MAG: hypothetical protein WDO19_01485 [Bacteroidota bacterium]